MSLLRNIFIGVAVIFGAVLAAYDYSSGINVKEFGAVGDGVADDTAAIRRAMSFARMQVHQILLARQPMLTGAPELGDLPILGMTSENTVIPEVYFPAGIYRVTDTLAGSAFAVLRGDGDATIRMEVPDKDVFYFHWGYRIQFRGLEIDGGRRQIMVYTGNNDVANFTVEHCLFRNSSGPALWSHNPLRSGGHDFATMTIGPYEVDFSGEVPVLTPNDVEQLPYYANSTNISVYDSRFEDCHQAFDLGADGVTVADCVVRVAPDSAVAAMRITGAVHLYRITGTAPATTSARYWLEGYGNWSMEDSEFEKEGDTGMSLLYWPGQPRGECTTALRLARVRLNCAGSPENAVVVIGNRAIECTPNYLDFENIEECSGKTVLALAWEVPPTEERLKQSEFDQQPAVNLTGGAWTTRWPFTVTMTDCPQLTTGNFPECMKNSIEAPLPPEALAAVTVPESSLDRDAVRRGFSRTLRAAEFGVDLDGDSDDTAAMKRVLAAAADGAPALVELPPVYIRISEALTLPPEIGFRAPGFATLYQTDFRQPIFRGEKTRTFYAENIRFSSGKNALTLAPAADVPAVVLLERCFFYQQLAAAVEVLAPTPDNRTELLMVNNVFVSPVQGVVTNAAHSEIDNFWVSTNGRQNDEAFIVNRGGDMLVKDMLGVPMPMSDHRFNFLPVVPDWPYAKNLRWFDNYGRLDLRNCRFGGEYFGIPLVFNFNPEGTVAMNMGVTCFFHPEMKQCMLYCVADPAAALLRNVGWTFRWPEARTVKRPESNPDKPVVYVRNFFFEEDSFEKR